MENKKDQNKFVKSILPEIKRRLAEDNSKSYDRENPKPCVEFKRIDKSLPKHEYKMIDGIMGIELYSRDYIGVLPGSSAVLSLNVMFTIPEGYIAKIYPLKNLYNSKGLIFANSVELVQQDFEELKIEVVSSNPTYNTVINRGDPIGKLVFVKVEKLPIVETE